MSDDLGDRVLETFTAMGDEEQEQCIHCGRVWYKIHHKDGVCHVCEGEGRPGRTELARRKRNRGYLSLFLVTAVIAVVLLILRAV
ncbi:MAG: hypothetical protein UT32_C0011G0009 [Parcubacteria group bacterium GW2011_GWC2_39_14]|nr:MAG: hypothetical protein UT32_C0011G0009 [Parcubacteria group bacterium GW2011_GWC2_39_14]